MGCHVHTSHRCNDCTFLHDLWPLLVCRHILVAIGADRMLRFWDCFSGVCVVDHFTGHKQGESVVALTLAPDNMTLVTADTAGYIMVRADSTVLCMIIMLNAIKGMHPSSSHQTQNASCSDGYLVAAYCMA